MRIRRELFKACVTVQAAREALSRRAWQAGMARKREHADEKMRGNNRRYVKTGEVVAVTRRVTAAGVAMDMDGVAIRVR